MNDQLGGSDHSGVNAEQVRAFVANGLSLRVVAPPHRFPRGFGNDNWRVPTADGDLVVKIARPQLPGEKLLAAARAHRLAAGVGVPVPELIMVDASCDMLGGRSVRVQEYCPGEHPGAALHSAAAIATFYQSVGHAVARLHSVRLASFSSRVGGGPSFPTWGAYVERRVGQIMARVEAVGGVPDVDHGALLDRAVTSAAEVSSVVLPTLTHRDLYLDNLLVAPDGAVAAMLDFDLAEVWDPVVDLVKLRWLVEPVHPGAVAAFWEGYRVVPDLLAQRLWVVEIMELVNTIANAVANDLSQAKSAQARLAVVLAE